MDVWINEWYEIRQMASCELTLLHAGVQLGDLDGQAVDSVLERIGTPVKGVGLIEELSKHIFCMFTCITDRKEAMNKYADEAFHMKRKSQLF